MDNEQYKYEPRIVYPPSETILELLDEHRMTQKEFSEKMGTTPKTINKLIQGDSEITPETALKLEKIFQMPAHIWLNLEREFREYLARNNETYFSESNKIK